ncbi:hypothetical protein CFOL_v3_20648 [Cephalotus follicularis]|uniref:NTP_transf_2 domain-containing protein n=1 Tax=Cephalotus follicularis TaxID=3775 RepID=A0A1Q3CAA1_CEPFO|nr:hypothetical protein CFOL_v3_20648 [Cephalotus follicularis]
MGDLRDWSPESNGVLLEERPLSSSSSVLSNQTVIAADYWKKAEAATQSIIAQVQPSTVSEERRKSVIDYVQRLIKHSLGCEVFPFGSVPLKTYLPDGDIDLTTFGGLNVEEALANDVFSVLEREQNGASEFVVKDVQLIRAEVKLVKCLVQNIVVDISFNQLGGLCTVCFLEQVDRLIGKDHLFKRSIILIKAWCYYESRILGAHHGLISTYALETLVLYIFHLFHTSLDGPLAVLYKFLDYFSKFDWDNFCISLNGPVRLSSLPDFVVVETPENSGGNLLLSNDFLRDCVELFSVPLKGFETNSRSFPPKHLNIVDPLKENNNLGRSVSKGNFFRIRSAFTYGARKLGRILSQPVENIAVELCKFFANTLDRHGSGQRPDVQDPVPASGHSEFGSPMTFSYIVTCQEEQKSSSDITGNSRLDHEALVCGGVHNVNLLGVDLNIGRTMNEPQVSANGIGVSENRLSGDANDLATSRMESLAILIDKPQSSLSSGQDTICSLGKPSYAPHLYFSRSLTENGELRNGNPELNKPEISWSAEKNVSSAILPAHNEDTRSVSLSDQDDNRWVDNHRILSPVRSKDISSLLGPISWSEDLDHGHSSYRDSTGIAGSPEALISLSDLSGDYETHLNSLHYGRWCYDYAIGTPIPPMSSPLLSQFHSKNSWDVVRQSLQFRQMNANGVVPRPVFYPMNPSILPGAPFGIEEMPKPRGTGTYIPNTNHYRDRPLTPRGRNQGPVRSPRNSTRVGVSPERFFSGRISRDLPQAQFTVHQNGGKSGSADLCRPGSPESRAYPNANGSGDLSEMTAEFGSIVHLPLATSSLESSRQLNPGSGFSENSASSSPLGRPKPVLGMGQNRIAVQSFRLKDEDDFPPLSI